MAASKGYLSSVKYIIDNFPEYLDLADGEGNTPLAYAVYYGHTEIVKYLIEKGAKLGNQNIIGNSPLYFAARRGHLDIVKIINEAQPKIIEPESDLIELKNKNGESPLLAAITKGQVEVVTYLIEQGANLNQKMLFLAISLRYLEIIQKLLAKRPDLLKVVNQSGINVLQQAARYGDLSVLAFLLDLCPALLEVRNRYSLTPLHIAAWYGHADAVAYLLKKGANLEAVTSRGHNALHLAARYGHLNVVKIILEANPNLLESKDKLGQTALVFAAAKGHADIVEYLIHQGANLEAATDYPDNEDHGKTPLIWALKKGHSKVFAMLLAAGAKQTVHLDQLTTQMIDAGIKEGLLELVQTLFKNHPDLIDAASALSAAQHNQPAILSYLLKQGACKNENDIRNVTLSAMSAGDHLDVIKILFKDCQDQKISAFVMGYAFQYDRIKTVSYLLPSYKEKLSIHSKTANLFLYTTIRDGHSKMVKMLQPFFNGVWHHENLIWSGAIIHSAIQEDLFDILTFCMTHGPSDILLEAVNEQHQTPLASAIVGGRKNMIEYLIQQGANLTPTLPHGKTLLELAEEGQDPEIIKILNDAIDEHVQALKKPEENDLSRKRKREDESNHTDSNSTFTIPGNPTLFGRDASAIQAATPPEAMSLEHATLSY